MNGDKTAGFQCNYYATSYDVLSVNVDAASSYAASRKQAEAFSNPSLYQPLLSGGASGYASNTGDGSCSVEFLGKGRDISFVVGSVPKGTQCLPSVEQVAKALASS